MDGERKTEEREFKKKFDELVQSSENILITTHMGPDNDAISSLLSLTFYFEKFHSEKSIQPTISGFIDESFNYLTGFEKIKWVDDISKIIHKFDLVIFLDGNYDSRFTQLENLEKVFKGKKICIDHHESNHTSYDLEIIRTNSIATAELIYRIFFSELDQIEKELGSLLMDGIMGDTGFFRFLRFDNAHAFDSIREIIEKSKLDLEEIYRKQTQISEKGFEVYRNLIKNTNLGAVQNYKICYSYLNFEETQDASNIKAAMATYKMQILRQIKGYNFGFLVYPMYSTKSNMKREFELSFRSTVGAPNVKKICMELFNGNGHIFASGGKLTYSKDKEISEVVDEILGKLNQADLEIITI